MMLKSLMLASLSLGAVAAHANPSAWLSCSSGPEAMVARVDGTATNKDIVLVKVYPERGPVLDFHVDVPKGVEDSFTREGRLGLVLNSENTKQVYGGYANAALLVLDKEPGRILARLALDGRVIFFFCNNN